MITCACGCGESFEPSRSTRWRLATGRIDKAFIVGHNGKGHNNGKWTGGRALSANGYWMLKRPSHPNATLSGYVLEHRFVVSEHIGRPLHDHEVVHHIDGNKLNNDLANLVLHTRASHALEHKDELIARSSVLRVPKTCPACGIQFVKKENFRRARFCSRACRNAAGPQHPRRKASRSSR